jgi:murein DD-endopeptidase MepM/ murein hydrolase activator NlpD
MSISWKTAVAAAAGIVVVGAGVWLALRMEGEPPVITFAKPLAAVGKSTPWAFTAFDAKSGLRQLRAWARQGEKNVPLFSEDFPGRGTRRREVALTLDPKALGLADGPATLIVAAQDHSLKGFTKGNSVFVETPVVIDTEAPRLEILSTQHNVNRGGVGLVVYRLGEPAARTGVELGDRFFPGYPEAAGGAGAHVAYFAFPWDGPAAPAFSVVARDAAGNEVRRGFAVRPLEKVFPSDTIEISARFLATKIPEFRAADPSLPADPVAAFLVVNRDWRARDHARIRELCAAGSPARLWDGPFLQMPNTKNMAGWAEARTYVSGGKVIDRQTHLGLDLASTAGAPVPAANAGVAVFSGDLGIYGQAVILDHGQGVFSLYGHLSGLVAKVGQKYARGETIGASGQTGMAGGDHLHFSTLVSGTFVSPAEWFDAHWIADNVMNKLALFGGAPAAAPAPATTPATTPPAAPAR